MKILYALQGTGNGHTSRAIEVIPALLNRAEVDVLVSGIQADLQLPFEVKYTYKGLSFIFGKNGGIDYLKTFQKNSIFTLMKEIKKCPVHEYDLVINDFEPVSAWACKYKNVKCISLSHQSALLSDKVPRANHSSWLAEKILHHYAPSMLQYGFHFKKYDKSIFLPIIRNNIRFAEIKKKKHYTVYLPAYSDTKIIKVLSKFKKEKWHVFSKEAKKAYSTKNVFVKPIETYAFEKSITTCRGVICGAGFETPAEALYLKKKLLVIPMKGQYEQHLNAASLKELGVTVINKLHLKYHYHIAKWLLSKKNIEVSYQDKTQEIIDAILIKYKVANEIEYQVMQEI